MASGGPCVEFSESVFAEIGGGGSFEALFAVDGGVDLIVRKKEPVLRRLILQAFHFAESQEGGCFLHGDFVLGLADGLEGLQDGESLLNGAVEALLEECEELQLLRFHGEDARGGQGGVDLFVLEAELATIFVKAEGEEVVLDGAGAVETPAVGGDTLGELDLHGPLGREARNEGFGEFVVGGAILVGHGGDLAGEAVTERVHAGALSALFRLCPC